MLKVAIMVRNLPFKSILLVCLPWFLSFISWSKCWSPSPIYFIPALMASTTKVWLYKGWQMFRANTVYPLAYWNIAVQSETIAPSSKIRILYHSILHRQCKAVACKSACFGFTSFLLINWEIRKLTMNLLHMEIMIHMCSRGNPQKQSPS